ncbi:hypothetical protein FACS1894103_3970 [Campylobacterota bacterium]|nr:hypothetical protein FACS1894103_3970 [Campylobacterota bacterium]
MQFATVSANEFAQAKRKAATAPVIITAHGRPAYALLNIKDFYQLTKPQSLLSLMDSVDGGEFEFEPAKFDDHSLKPLNF